MIKNSRAAAIRETLSPSLRNREQESALARGRICFSNVHRFPLWTTFENVFKLCSPPMTDAAYIARFFREGLPLLGSMDTRLTMTHPGTKADEARTGFMDKDLCKAKKELLMLFDSQPLAVLATQNQGQPYASLVAFASSKNLKSLYFATTRSTRKYANFLADPRVAMLVDNRSNQASDFRCAMAVTATGKAEEVDPEKEASALDLYLAKHPHLRDFVQAPTCAFCEIRVRTYFVVTRFQDVVEVHIMP